MVKAGKPAPHALAETMKTCLAAGRAGDAYELYRIVYDTRHEYVPKRGNRIFGLLPRGLVTEHTHHDQHCNVFVHVLRNGITFDLPVFYAAMAACKRIKDVARARGLLQEIKECGLAPEPKTYCVVLEVCSHVLSVAMAGET